MIEINGKKYSYDDIYKEYLYQSDRKSLTIYKLLAYLKDIYKIVNTLDIAYCDMVNNQQAFFEKYDIKSYDELNDKLIEIEKFFGIND